MYILSITFANANDNERNVCGEFKYFNDMDELTSYVRFIKKHADELLRYAVYEWSITNENTLLEYNVDSGESDKFYDYINCCY